MLPFYLKRKSNKKYFLLVCELLLKRPTNPNDIKDFDFVAGFE